MQGFGNVGSFFAKFVGELGAKVVAISDSTGGVHNANGIDVAAAFAHKRSGGSLSELKGGDRITNEELVTLDCDVFAPCALEQVVTEENAAQVKAKVIVEGANGPLTPAADSRLASATLRMSTERPSISTVPLSGRTSPPMMLISVDFPAPFSPRSAWISPASSEKSTSFRAWTPPNRLVTPRKVRRGRSLRATSGMGLSKSLQELVGVFLGDQLDAES